MAEELLTKEQVAERLQVHPNTLDNWAKRGYGPQRIRLGKKVLYVIADLDNWLDAQRDQPGDRERLS